LRVSNCRQYLLFLFFVLFCGSCSSTEEKKLPVDPAVKKEVEVGRALAARLAKKYGMVQDQEFTVYVNSVGALIAKNSSRQELNFRFGILNTDEVNAFACPGGYVFITRGAISQIDDEAELASILSHELSHVTLKHSGNYEENKVGWLDVLASIMAPGGDFVSAFTKTAVDGIYKQILEEGRKKEEEMDADKAGTIYLSLAGYDLSSAIRYLEKLDKSQHNETVLKTHPPTKERIGELNRFIKEQSLPVKGNSNRERFQKYLQNFQKNNPPSRASSRASL
jgi:predicted Zn-dependent protease